MTPLFRGLLALFLFAGIAVCQEHATDPDQEKEKETEPGIPVTDSLTLEKCGGCHVKDSYGNLSRISWIRTTPEGWQQAIKRMGRLNGLKLTPAESHHIVHYLGTDHGVAPEELKPVSWFVEMRLPQTEPYPNDTIRHACASCHALARPMSWHRSKAEWQLLVNMHIGYYPISQFIGFHAPPPPPDDPNAAKFRQPVDEAVEYFSKNYPLYSPEWSAWHAQATDPDLRGRWLITASAAGKGRSFGVMTVRSTAPGEFATDATLTSARDGSVMKMPGKANVYTGYQWRGSETADGIGPVREVMTLSPDGSTLTGRWFWGTYQEFGYDVTARRESGDLSVLGSDVTALRAGASGQAMKVIGEHFPSDLKISDINLGSGVKVDKVVSVKPNEVSLLVSVDPTVVAGKRAIALRGRTVPDAFAVYGKVDYIKISSDTSLAHLGGVVAKKGFVQFEAEGYSAGLDGLPHTADDVSLGPIPVEWSIEEFISHNNDTDKEFVGYINPEGLFTPGSDGPNPQRRFSADNTGDVWVVAKFKDAKEASPLEAKGYLVVTVPTFLHWDEPEVGQ